MTDFWKQREPICNEIWNFVICAADVESGNTVILDDKDQHRLTKDNWKNALSQMSIDMTDTEQSNLFDQISSSDDQQAMTKDMWIEYWKTSTSSTSAQYWSLFQRFHSAALTKMNRDIITSSGGSNNALCCYQWRIPRYNSMQIKLLIYGWIQQNKCNLSQSYIPIEIMKIIIHYFYDPTHFINKIKNSDKSECFESGIFAYKSCKFYFELHNRQSLGFEQTSSEFKVKSVVDLRIVLLYKPKNIDSISLKYVYGFWEKFILSEPSQEQLQSLRDYAVCNLDTSITDIQHLSTLTFNFFIHGITAFDHHQEIVFRDSAESSNESNKKVIVPMIIPESSQQTNEMEIFIWRLSESDIDKVKTAKPKDTIKSEIFMMHGLKWQAWIWPNGDGPDTAGQVDMIVHLISIPAYLDSIDIHHQIKFEDKPLKLQREFATLSSDVELCSRVSPWQQNLLKTNELIESDNPVFEIMSQVINKSYTDECKDFNVLPTNMSIQPVPFGKLKTLEWKISPMMLQKIKSCESTESFMSDLFVIDGFTAVLEFYPKRRKCVDIENECGLYMHLLSIPSDIFSVSMAYCFRVKHMHRIVECSWIDQINNYLTPVRMDTDCLSMKVMQDLKSLTLECDFQVMDITDKNGDSLCSLENVVFPRNIDLNQPQQFIWSPSMNIKDIPSGNAFMSDIFRLYGFKWYLLFIPKRTETSTEWCLWLCLADLPPDISDIVVYFKVCIDKIGVARSYAIRVNAVKLKFEMVDGGVLLRDLLNVDNFSFDLQMTLLAVYDTNGDDVTDECLEQKENAHNDITVRHEWKCDEVNVTKLESSYFRLIQYGLEYKVLFDGSNDQGSTEIVICVKELPKWMKQINLKCQVILVEKNVEICGVIYFTQNKLKSVLIDCIKLEGNLTELDSLTFTITMQEISVHGNAQYCDMRQMPAITLLDELLYVFD